MSITCPRCRARQRPSVGANRPFVHCARCANVIVPGDGRFRPSGPAGVSGVVVALAVLSVGALALAAWAADALDLAGR